MKRVEKVEILLELSSLHGRIADAITDIENFKSLVDEKDLTVWLEKVSVISGKIKRVK
jgi:hypothetical protein